MSDRFVTFARQRDALMAVVSQANEEEIGLRCALVPRRIEEVGESVCASGPLVARAWRTLAWSRLDEAGGVAAAVVVLLETVPTEERGAPRLRPLSPPRLARRTSAHPRGVLEPRSPRPRAADLRGSLATQGSWLAVRDALRSHRRRVFRMLREAGYDDGRLAWLASARDPYAAYHHGAPDEAGLSALPRPFRLSILPLLRRRSWPDVMRSLRLYRELGLEYDPDLLALVVRLLAVSPEHGLGWCDAAGTQAPDRRPAFVRVLLETGASAVHPSALHADALGRLAGFDASRYGDRLTFLLESLCGGHPVEHALEAFRIADAFAPGHQFMSGRGPHPRSIAPRRGTPIAIAPALRAVLDHVVPAIRAAGYGGSLPMVLWERSVRDPAFAKVLAHPALRAWPRRTALGVLRQLVYEEDVPLDEQLRAIQPLLAAVPETHHGMAIDALDALFFRWRRAEEQRRRLPVACALLARLARPPFRADLACGDAVALLVEAAWPARVARLLSAPDASIARLEAALHREHSASLITKGLEALARRTGGLVVEALIRNPDALFATARLLACLRLPRRLAVLDRYRAHPIGQRSFLKRPVDQMSRLVEPLVRDGLPNPVPRRLRDHLAGRIALTPGSVERHRQAVERGMLPLKLALLRRMALADLGRGLPALDVGVADERHALQMVGSVSMNRRILRRVLKVQPAARRDFLQAHHSNRAWLRKHPRVDAALWTHGIEQAARDGRGPLRLAIETEPLSVLRLGTDVGSCLSVGGCWADSAVAVMVDVNKQVVFARRPDGTFVARQLVALSEDERLVFFPVYPLTAAAEVKEAFHRYDLAFASALGLPPFVEDAEGAESYTIASVLARAFHDDGVWDRFQAQ